jgi:protein phosphatase
VCDGVAGGTAGEIASEHAVRRILNDYYQAPADQPALPRLLAAIQQANADIVQENMSQPEGRRMTTTVVAAVWQNPYLILVHAGDSRAYLVRSGQITQLTRDHSWVAEMVRSGDLTQEEAVNHPWRNRITRALGMKENVDLDAQTVEVRSGDRLVLCSDGLTRHVSDAEIAAAVTQQAPRLAGQQLIGLANQRGGSDNISVIVAELDSKGAVQEVERVLPATEERTQKAKPAKPSRSWLMLTIVIGILLVVIIATGAFYVSRYGWALPKATPIPTAPAPTATAMPTSAAAEVEASATPTGPPTPTAAPPTSTTRPTPTATATATVTVTPTAQSTSVLQPTAVPAARGTATPGPTRVLRSTIPPFTVVVPTP